MQNIRHRRVLRWDPYLEPGEGDMHFRLTYEGPLLAHRDDDRLRERSLHVHDIRKQFHKQMANLNQLHPVLAKERKHKMGIVGTAKQQFDREDFLFDALVTKENGLICALDVLMLREGPPGKVLHDVDNRLKTILDALVPDPVFWTVDCTMRRALGLRQGARRVRRLG
jgi:hypothetical protein